eukprot:INCI19731.1.p1 GENE.INCI19731.1~~INCI19731.1.p1  ORF type:complete len:396 (-),score=48.48 INCI19731.1:2-1189(-)
MMFWALALACIAVFAAGGGWKTVAVLGDQYGSVDALAFRGVSLDHGRYWVLVSATFCHATLFHLANNCIVLVVVHTIELELAALLRDDAASASFSAATCACGAGQLIAFLLFLGLGGCGWLLSYLSLRIDSESYLFMRYADTVGSSPSTYGLSFLAACAIPFRTFALPWPSQLVPAWLWLGMLVFLPFVRRPDTVYGWVVWMWNALTPTNRANLNRKLEQRNKAEPYCLKMKILLQLLNVSAIGILSYCLVRPACRLFFSTNHHGHAVADSPTFPVWLWFVGNVVRESLMRRMRGKDKLGQSNEMSHLGGCVGGFAVWLLFQLFRGVCKSWSRGAPSGASVGLGHRFVAFFLVTGCLIELLSRVVHEHPTLLRALWTRHVAEGDHRTLVLGQKSD